MTSNTKPKGEPDRYQQYPYEFYKGFKVKFKSEKQKYTVRCASKRYAICTKPFNARNTVLYCIIDQWTNFRAPEDLVFDAGAETDEQCYEMLVRLLDHESDLSRRHELRLDIETVYNEAGKPVAPKNTNPITNAVNQCKEVAKRASGIKGEIK